MFRLLLLSAVLAVALGQTKFCCTPDQWEGYLGEIAGSVVSGTTHLITGNISISYDYTNTKMATSSYLVIDGKNQDVTVIMDYQKKMMYTIIGTQCTTSQLTGDMMKLCVPDNAMPSGKFTYGAGSTTLDAMAYLVPAGPDSTVYVTTTVGNPCVPIGEVLYGTPNKIPTVQTMGYYNISPGIKDPQIFNPPSSCSGQKFLKPAPVLTNFLMKHMHAKVTKH
ncbi:uncharacterized protein LOC135461927 [Liolophura sinensis]|uniref:uncharacterized protein LOC135461927 n=1 Tax=Liolophura sinensis TaxID=3198878 RepID=UPI0031598D44